MPWLALALALAAAQAPPAASSLGAVADAVAAQVGAPEEGRRGLALALAAEPAGLAPPLSAALAAALGRAGWAVSPVAAGAAAEGAARAAGADWLLSLAAGGGPERREVVAVGEATPLWASFFLQARPGVRAAPPRPVSARAPADAAAALLLGRPAAAAPSLTLRELARLPAEVVALAAGEVDGIGPALLTVCRSPDGGPDAATVRLLDRRGVELASRPVAASSLRPARRLAAAAVVAPLGAGPLAVALAGAGGAEVLAPRGGRLERVATLPMAPLAAGEAGLLFGAFAPGKAALQDLLSVGVDPAARPRSAGDLVAAAAAPGPGAPAFAALHPDGRLELLDGALAPAGAVAGVGAGFALADLDGDGRTEVVASATGPGGPDQLRVVRPPEAAAPAWTSPPIPGAVQAAAAWDLTGDGRDDAVAAAVEGCGPPPGGEGACATTLWLLTLDPGAAP